MTGALPPRPSRGTFTESHSLAISQAICDYRRGKGIDGPLYAGKDTHCLSGPAQRTALEVLAGNGVQTAVHRDDGVTPPAVISRAILVHNRGGTDHPADGIVVTPSHNPPYADRRPDHARAEGAAPQAVPQDVTASVLAGAPVGGLKVVTASGWSRPGRRAPRTSTSCMRSFASHSHLDAIVAEAQRIDAGGLFGSPG